MSDLARALTCYIVPMSHYLLGQTARPRLPSQGELTGCGFQLALQCQLLSASQWTTAKVSQLIARVSYLPVGVEPCTYRQSIVGYSVPISSMALVWPLPVAAASGDTMAPHVGPRWGRGSGAAGVSRCADSDVDLEIALPPSRSSSPSLSLASLDTTASTPLPVLACIGYPKVLRLD